MNTLRKAPNGGGGSAETGGPPSGARRRRVALSVIAGMVIALMPILATPAAAAPLSLDVTLSLDYFERFEVPDDGIDEEGEFFPEVVIGDGGAVQRGAVVSDDRFVPSTIPEHWVFSQNVTLPEGATTVPVLIRIWDEDGGLNGGDDRMDVSPRNQDVELNLQYDLLTQRWTGDDVPPSTPCVDHDGISRGQTCAAGDGDPNFPENGDGKRVTLGFSLSTPDLPDIDADGIPDLVELSGVRDSAGAMVADLRALGADPCRKSVVVQVDYMTGAADGHTHQPKAAALTAARDVFDAAPVDAVVPCPYAGTHKAKGIDFVSVPGMTIPEQAQVSLDSDFYRNARSANFPAALAPYAHYAIAAHDRVEDPGSSGQCCEPIRDNNKDFIVSLGSWRVFCVGDFGTEFAGDAILQTTAAGDDTMSGNVISVGPNRTCDTTSADRTDLQVLTPGTGADDAEVGTVQDQAGTIVHELGHALGLDHGGDTGTQFKSNYISLMNYFFQTGIPTGPPPLLINQFSDWRVGTTRLDLSQGKLPKLDENLLAESAGIGDGTDFTFWWTPNPDPTKAQRLLHAGPGNAALNWDDSKNGAGEPTIDTSTVTVDINASGSFEELSDHDDWNAIMYRAVRSPDAKGKAVSGFGVGALLGPELTFRTALSQDLAFFEIYDPDLAVTKSVDKVDAQPGDTLGYSVRMDNIGTGAATAVGLTDILPDGTTVTRSRAGVDAGRSATEPFSYLVPCTTVDATVLTNRATATASDAAGGPEANAANNTGTATTTVHAPRLTLAETATPTVNAGEAITTDFVVANTGSGTATDVTLTETLSAEVYYSQALDRGTGPKPNTVVRNADGTTTLTWSLGSLVGGASKRIQLTVRPSLLIVAGTTLVGTGSVAYRNSNGCVYQPATATAATRITAVPPSRNPLSHGYWKTHPEAQTAELLARVQATDQRFDGATGTAPDGALSVAEAGAVLAAGGNQPGPVRFQLLATLFDLSARRINAATTIDSPLSRQLGVKTVGAAVRYAFATLGTPVSSATAGRYSDATTLLDQIVNNKSEVY